MHAHGVNFLGIIPDGCAGQEADVPHQVSCRPQCTPRDKISDDELTAFLAKRHVR